MRETIKSMNTSTIQATAKELAIIAPVPVTNYETSDGKTHKTEIDAIAHETFLAVKGDLGLQIGGRFSSPSPDEMVYEVVTALAKKYHFTPRSLA